LANVAAVRRISGPPIPREEPESTGRPEGRDEIVAAALVARAGSRPAPAGRVDPVRLGVIALEERLLEPDSRPEETGPGFDTDAASVSYDAEATVLYDPFAREMSSAGRRRADGAVGEGAPPKAAFEPAADWPGGRQRAADAAPPLVMVDIDAEVAAMVDRLALGVTDEAAEVELLRQGERAMPAIMARFPGVVVFERSRLATLPNPPKASECGVVLRLVARQRKAALPFVLERLIDPDPERRGWAVHLLIELPYVEALPRVLGRLGDEDAAIRASSAHALAAIARIHPLRVVQALGETIADGDLSTQLGALRAVGQVRDPRLVPTLLRCLGDGDDQVVVAAHNALVDVTRQDFGADARPWLQWWERNASRDRLEWLIDALTHDVSEVRRAAGEELRVLSRQYFGYSPDLPLRDRERAQRRYRDWWITEGRSRQGRT
jgi:hypothetical protein